MTRKLYYEDSALTEFHAAVTGCTEAKGGYAVTLDQTAFYPEGGGQPWDLGKLGDANVLQVTEAGEDVVHLCDKPLTPGATVKGQVDWARRLDLMQQHTGEHILSGLICGKYGVSNVGFHVGAQVMEIDFSGPVPAEDLYLLELAANSAIWQDLQVQCTYPENLQELEYRSKKALEGPVRIVEIPGFDRCACCGVHVKHTGQVGIIKILSMVKFHQGVRLELVCGKRAFDYLAAVSEQNKQISGLLSAKPLETAQATKRLADQLAAEKFRAAGLEKKLFDTIAQSYVNQGLALHFEDSLTTASVRELADRIGKVSRTAIVCSGTDEAGYSICIIGASAKELGAAAANALNGRGGGKPEAFQGSLKATRSQIETHFSVNN